MEGSPSQHQAWLEMNWPVGYWALLRCLYGHPPTLPEDGLIEPTCIERCKYRAPEIYTLMTSAVKTSYVKKDFQFPEARRVALDADEIGLFDEDHEPLYEELRALLVEHRVQIPEEEWEEVDEGNQQFLENGGVDKSLLHPLIRDLPGTCDLLKGYRLRQLRTMCEVQRDVESENQYVSLASRGPWPNQATEAELQGMNLMDLARFRGQEMNAMIDFTLSLSRDDSYVTDDGHLSLWRYVARFRKIDMNHFSATKVGSVVGWFIVPFDREEAADPDDFFEAMDATSAQLNDVWKVLVGKYFPGLGIDSVNEFMSEYGELACLATAEFHLEPAFRGQGLVPSLLNEIDECLARPDCHSVDWDWKTRTQAATDLHFSDEDAEDEEIAHFTAPGVFIIPVTGEPPQDRTLNPYLRGSLGKVRKPKTQTEAELLKRKLIRHFEAMRDEVGADIVCYDPYDYPST